MSSSSAAVTTAAIPAPPCSSAYSAASSHTVPTRTVRTGVFAMSRRLADETALALSDHVMFREFDQDAEHSTLVHTDPRGDVRRRPRVLHAQRTDNTVHTVHCLVVAQSCCTFLLIADDLGHSVLTHRLIVVDDHVHLVSPHGAVRLAVNPHGAVERIVSAEIGGRRDTVGQTPFLDARFVIERRGAGQALGHFILTVARRDEVFADEIEAVPSRRVGNVVGEQVVAGSSYFDHFSFSILVLGWVFGRLEVSRFAAVSLDDMLSDEYTETLRRPLSVADDGHFSDGAFAKCQVRPRVVVEVDVTEGANPARTLLVLCLEPRDSLPAVGGRVEPALAHGRQWFGVHSVNDQLNFGERLIGTDGVRRLTAVVSGELVHLLLCSGQFPLGSVTVGHRTDRSLGGERLTQALVGAGNGCVIPRVSALSYQACFSGAHLTVDSGNLSSGADESRRFFRGNFGRIHDFCLIHFCGILWVFPACVSVYTPSCIHRKWEVVSVSKSTGFTPEQSAAILFRDSYKCAMCGHVAQVANHRANRGAGGYLAANVLSNGCALCNLCNGLIESDGPFAELARTRGVKISKHADPRVVAYLHPLYNLPVLLDDLGGFVFDDNEAA